MKYVVVTGGVTSGVGKGTTTASLAYLLRQQGHRVAIAKFDGYMNESTGLICPYQEPPAFLWKGEEVFVLRDGTETDSDAGTYERFVDRDMTRRQLLTNGAILRAFLDRQLPPGVLKKVRPHLIREYRAAIAEATEGADVSFIEVGGTVGDDECAYFLQALRDMRRESPRDMVSVHVTYIPCRPNGEELLKPAKLSMLGTAQGPDLDFVVCRSAAPLHPSLVSRLSDAAGLRADRIFHSSEVGDPYEVPTMLRAQGIDNCLLAALGLESQQPVPGHIDAYLESRLLCSQVVRVCVVGDPESWDSFVSLEEGLRHAAVATGRKLSITWVRTPCTISAVDRVIIAEGIENLDWKCSVARDCLERRIPLLGISAGAQIIAASYAGSAWTFDNQTLQCGEQTTALDGWARNVYGATETAERHRRTGVIRPERLMRSDLEILGRGRDGEVHIFSDPVHHMVGVQFHPEYRSRPGKPHPLLCWFMGEGPSV